MIFTKMSHGNVLYIRCNNFFPFSLGLTFLENSSPIKRFRRQKSQSKLPAHRSVTTGVAIGTFKLRNKVIDAGATICDRNKTRIFADYNF